MAQQINNQSPYNREPKERKLLLAKLFTNAQVRQEPAEPKKIVAAGMVEADPTPKEYPDTFFGRAFKVFKGEMPLFLKAALLFLIFAIPFAIIVAWFANYYETLVLGGSYNFMGSVGVGFPGGGDNITESVATLLWTVKTPVLAMIGATLIFGAIGLPGIFYCAKRSYFQNVYKNPFRTFLLGIKKYWWQFLLTSTIMVVIGLGMCTALMFLLKQQTLGVAGAGEYCAVVFSWIAGLPMLAVCVVMMSLFTTYELNYVQCFKNAIVIIANNWATVIITCAVSAIPLGLCAMNGLMRIIVCIAMPLAGCTLMALGWIALGDRGMEKCKNRLATTNRMANIAHLKAQKEARKNANPYANGTVAAKTQPKKKAQPVHYQNPKKKKKK